MFARIRVLLNSHYYCYLNNLVKYFLKSITGKFRRIEPPRELVDDTMNPPHPVVAVSKVPKSKTILLIVLLIWIPLSSRKKTDTPLRSLSPTPTLSFTSAVVRCRSVILYLINGASSFEHGCTATGGGNTSPTIKLYKFYHILPTVRIFSHYLMHGMTLKVLKNSHRARQGNGKWS